MKNPVYCICRKLSKLLLKVFYGLTVTHEGPSPSKGGLIITANHVSNLDPLVLGVSVRRDDVRFIAKEELFRVPFLGSLLRALNVIPLKRGGSDLRAMKIALGELARGSVVALFPEGTRSADGNPGAPQTGIGFMACKSGAPVLPVYISGTKDIYPRNGRMKLRGKIRAYCGEVKRFSCEGSAVSGKRDMYRDISAEVMNEISRIKKRVEDTGR